MTDAKFISGKPLGIIAVIALIVAPISNPSRGISADAQAASPTPAPTLNPLFQSALPKLKATASIPILLPAIVPFHTATRGSRYANVSSVTGLSYEVVFENSANCNFSSICNDGAVLSPPASGPVDVSNYKTTKTVVLNNGMSAIAGIPIYRQPTTITWDQGGQRYTIIFPVASYPKDLVNMANSMTTIELTVGYYCVVNDPKLTVVTL